MTKLIILTDVHFVPAGDTIVGLDPGQRLAAATAHIRTHHSDAALLVVTGDLTHYGDADSYARLRTSLDDLPIPHVLLIGNHDRRDAFQAAFPEALRDDHGFVQGYRDIADARLIFLDTVIETPRSGETHHAGYYCARRRAWLDRTLADARDRRAYIFMHHPPHRTGFAGMDRIRLTDEDAFYDVLSRHRHVAHIFAGHIHRTIGGTHRGVPFSIFKGTMHQQPMTFASLDTSLSNTEPAAYGIVFLTDHGVLVHTEDYELSASLPLL